MDIKWKSDRIYDYKGPAIYLRFTDKEMKNCNYVGLTKDFFKGRPFRKYARKKTGQCKKVVIIKCPEKRLNVREAYFILKFRPKLLDISKYFKIAYYLLKKEEVLDLLDNYILKQNYWKFRSPSDLKILKRDMQTYKTTDDKMLEREILSNLGLIFHKSYYDNMRQKGRQNEFKTTFCL